MLPDRDGDVENEANVTQINSSQNYIPTSLVKTCPIYKEVSCIQEALMSMPITTGSAPKTACHSTPTP